MIGRGLGHAEILPLFGDELGVESEFGHPDDTVHRGADLVAHIGQEIALGTVGGFGCFFRPLRGCFTSAQCLPHGVERLRKLAHLIFRSHRNIVGQTALSQFMGGVR